MLNSGLTKLLGFSRKIFEPGKEYTVDKPHRLAVYREIGMHLAEVSTSDNCITATHLRCLGVSPSRTKSVGEGGQRHSMSCSIRSFRLVLFHS